LTPELICIENLQKKDWLRSQKNQILHTSWKDDEFVTLCDEGRGRTWICDNKCCCLSKWMFQT